MTMQPATTPHSRQWVALLERSERNRAAMRAAAALLTETRKSVEERRKHTDRLLGECRRSRSRLADGLLSSRRLLNEPAAAAPVVPRHRPVQPDSLDTRRQELHEAYAAAKDPVVLADLMTSYDGFARSLALSFRHRESLDDLIQVARIGLLHAIDRFDPALGRPFPLFARITITGELKRHVRDRTWALRVPRSLQEDYLNVMRAVDELTAEHSGSPSIEALAAHCGLSVERVVEAMELRVSQRALSIDVPNAPGRDEPVIELGGDDIGYQQLENRQLLAHLLGRLPARDRRIIELRFIEEMTQSEIAAEIGVSQMCVSRVLARTLGRLRLWARTALN